MCPDDDATLDEVHRHEDEDSDLEDQEEWSVVVFGLMRVTTAAVMMVSNGVRYEDGVPVVCFAAASGCCTGHVLIYRITTSQVDVNATSSVVDPF